MHNEFLKIPVTCIVVQPLTYKLFNTCSCKDLHFCNHCIFFNFSTA